MKINNETPGRYFKQLPAQKQGKKKVSPNKTNGQTADKPQRQLSGFLLQMKSELPPEQWNRIVKIWHQMNLPFTEKEMELLFNYLKNTETPVREELIRSFAFLVKHNLPAVPRLMEGLTGTLDQNETLTGKIIALTNNLENSQANSIEDKAADRNNNPAGAGKPSKATPDKKTAGKIKDLLTVNLNRSPDEIAGALREYPRGLRNFLLTVQDTGSGYLQKIVGHLLGQQLINQQESNPERNLLLTLELPVLFKEIEDPLPLQLRIFEEGGEEHMKKKEQSHPYRLSFRINLQQRGTVRAEIIVDGKNILCNFWTAFDSTAEIIRSNFPQLAERLSEMGYRTGQPRIKNIGEDPPPPSQPLIETPGGRSKFTHIDIKI